jgi:hypothetical protein
MKLDLMIEQLLKHSQEGVTDRNLKEVRYYLRESSRVCHFHKLYLEAIIFLMVIPDFYGIDLLLDDLIDQAKENCSYEKKSFLGKS